ncbi:hypothetical protein [Sagittula sp. S175]|uniref:hypothetical protein n=1 Tax=Sagittula sp. S175 TaxID=3415129 RepID=UPI003C7E31F4
MNDPLPTRASLAVLMVIHLLMLFALYTLTAPHPPVAIPLFALAPFLSAFTAIAAATWIMAERPIAVPLSILTALLAAVSLGPHKYFDPAFSGIWPAVLTGQVAIVALMTQAVRALSARRTPKALPA